MRVTRKQLRRIINEEVKRRSEMTQFGGTRDGKRVREAGKKISSAASIIAEAGGHQTGQMSQALESISEFAAKFGATLESLGMLQEGESLTERMPTIQELKQVAKAIQKLEK